MSKPDVMMAVMKLTRAMRRGPAHHGPGGEPPMGGGRLMAVLKENSNVTSRELAELLDIRPSSLTELLTRLEKEELLTRTPDENDKRISRVALTEKGQQLESEMATAHNERLERFAACFTDEEAAAFCEMCEKLSVHLETMAKERGEGDFPPPPHHGCGHRHGHGGCHGEGGFPPPPPHHFHGPCGGGARHGHPHGPRGRHGREENPAEDAE